MEEFKRDEKEAFETLIGFIGNLETKDAFNKIVGGKKINRRADSLLNRIELTLQAIDNPRYCRNDALGQGRTILPDIKTKELGMLIEKLKELRSVIDPSDKGRSESYEGIKLRIEEKINKIFNPQILIKKEETI